MVTPQQPDPGARTRFVINLVGAVGLVFGVLPIVRYVLDLSLFEFTVAPYAWLRLEGAARFLPRGWCSSCASSSPMCWSSASHGTERRPTLDSR